TRSEESWQQPFDPAIEDRIATGVTPEKSLLQRERALRFHRAVESLSERQKRCLFLRLEGLRYAEIGAVLGISASTVGEFMRRAIAKLRASNE
ncbi:MAG: sigma-70 family RNA polymerase sigma factor, partial [Bryobacteraceae bacterium]|nr:sigma-70 family RNA polymerase sigma factor [Bryobacteraceae bacterium]